MNGLLTTRTQTEPLPLHRWVELLKTLADPMRLRMLRLLDRTGADGLRIGELATALKLPQSTVSRHMKALVDGKVAEGRRDGTSMLYRIIHSGRDAIWRQLHVMVKHQLLTDERLATDECRLNQALQDRQNLKVDFFGSAAPQWDTIRSQWFGDTFHLEAMLALLNPEWTIGDLGAGTGATFGLVAPHVKKVIAVEPSAPMLKAARNRIRMAQLKNVELLAGRMEQLPIENQLLDAALIVLVLHHVTNIESSLAEVHRVLKPGGVALIVDLLPHQVEMFREKMGHRWMGFAPDQLTGQLRSAGLTDVRRHTLPSRKSRSPESRVAVPDLFVLRATRPRN